MQASWLLEAERRPGKKMGRGPIAREGVPVLSVSRKTVAVQHEGYQRPSAANCADQESKSSMATTSSSPDEPSGRCGAQIPPDVAPQSSCGAEDLTSGLDPWAPPFRAFGSPLSPAPPVEGGHLQAHIGGGGDALHLSRVAEGESGSHQDANPGYVADIHLRTIPQWNAGNVSGGEKRGGG